MWIQAIHRENFVPTNNSMVCSLHFTSDDYQKRPDLIKLTNKAIPSVFIKSENAKQNDNKKKAVMNAGLKSSQKPIRKPYNNLSDHTYVLKLPEPPPSEKIPLQNTVDPTTFNVDNIQLEKSIDPSICMVQIMKMEENSVDKPYVLSKLKNPTLQFIKSIFKFFCMFSLCYIFIFITDPCQKPPTKIMENNQNSLEVSDRKWKEIVFAQSITIKELRKKVKILQQKVRRHTTKLETLKVNICTMCVQN